MGETTGLISLTRCRQHHVARSRYRAAGTDGIGATVAPAAPRLRRSAAPHHDGIRSLDANPAWGDLDIDHNVIADCGENGIQVWRSELGEDGTRSPTTASSAFVRPPADRARTATGYRYSAPPAFSSPATASPIVPIPQSAAMPRATSRWSPTPAPGSARLPSTPNSASRARSSPATWSIPPPPASRSRTSTKAGG